MGKNKIQQNQLNNYVRSQSFNQDHQGQQSTERRLKGQTDY